ncbi:MAG TPA: hypothetical protein VLM85_32160 [Polyangiaceae bacterium]|nr:hypothetical protein [Polyangiaceae bacterium]
MALLGVVLGGCMSDGAGTESGHASAELSGPGIVGSRTGGGWGLKNLSTEGTLDWAHWGLSNVNSFNHKSGVTPQISNFKRLGNGPTLRLNCCADRFSWTGGTPTASATNVIGGVYVDTPNANGDGFELTMPADTTTKTLKLYTGFWCARAKLQATLSDGSAPVYVDTSADVTDAWDTSVYTIDFRAAANGQTLTVDYLIDLNHCTKGDTGEVWLLAATLAGTNTCTPTTCAAQGKNCGTIGDGCGGTLSCGTCTSPQTCGGGGTPNVCGAAAGTLTGSRSGAAWSAKNLSTEGTTDWAHWGLTGVTSFNHKAGITQQISNFTRLGTASTLWLDCCAGTFSWTGGTPTTSASNVIGGVYVDTPSVSGDGFQITVPADTTRKTLNLYTGYWCARAKLQATLSDGSAPAYVDTSADLTDAWGTSVYTVNFNAAASAQVLTVNYTIDLNHCTSGDTGEVWLLAATLAGSTCTPTTCAAQGKNCGTISDGCGGTLSCGTCTSPQTCGGGGTPNVCGTCTPTSCTAQGKNCGTISDGCGGTLSCGTCTSPQTCGGGGVANVCGTGSSAMPLLSRTVPATSSSGIASWAQDDSYGGIPWGFHMADIGVGWLTYDLSAVPAAQRQKLLVALYMGVGDQYYQLNYRAAAGYIPDDIPDAYVLEGAASASGPWAPLVTVSTNNNPFKSHYIGDFSAYSFLRFRVTSGPYGCHVKMDAYDASQGIGDGIVFYGDSITTNIFSGHYNGYGPEWFSKPIQASRPAFFPFVLGGGWPSTTAEDAVALIVTNAPSTFTAGLSTPLKTIFQYAKYAALIFGANDAADQSLVNAFRANYTQIINALRANGQRVALASPTWATDSTRQAGLVQIRGTIGYQLPSWAAGSYASGTYVWNATRAYLCTTGGTSVTGPTGTGTGIADGGTARWSYVPSLREDYANDPGVIGGPDLYTVFLNHPEWLSDGLHPNDLGEVQWRAAWVSWALASVY